MTGVFLSGLVGGPSAGIWRAAKYQLDRSRIAINGTVGRSRAELSPRRDALRQIIPGGMDIVERFP